MKTKIYRKTIAATIAMVALAISSNSQSLKWAKTVDGTLSKDDKGYATCVDASANVYTTGYVQNSSDGYEIIVKKYNSAGTLQWTGTHSGTNTAGVIERGNCIAVDPSNGNVFVAATAYIPSSGDNDFCLLKWSSAGVEDVTNYPKIFADNSGSGIYPEAKSVVIVSTTAVYVSGSSYDATTTKWTLVVEKCDPTVSGTAWDATFTPYTYTGIATATQTGANDLRANGSYVYVTGTYSNTSQGTNCVTAKLDASSGLIQTGWPALYNNSSSSFDEAGNALEVDAAGKVWVAGYQSASSSNKNAIVIQYSSGGAQNWVSPAYDSGNNLDDVWNDIALFPGGGGTIAGVTGYSTLNATAGSLNQDYITATYEGVAGGLWTSWSTNPKTYNGGNNNETSTTDEAWGIEYQSNEGRLYVSGRSEEINSEMDITTIGYTASNGTQAWIGSYSNTSSNQDEMFNKYALATRWNSCNCSSEIYVAGGSDVANLFEDCVTLKYGCGTCTNCCRMANSNYLEAGLFPNPFSMTSTLRIDQETTVSNATLKIYDLSGKLISEKAGINSNEIIIERADMTSGIYFYELTDANGVLASGKFAIED